MQPPASIIVITAAAAAASELVSAWDEDKIRLSCKAHERKNSTGRSEEEEMHERLKQLTPRRSFALFGSRQHISFALLMMFFCSLLCGSTPRF